MNGELGMDIKTKETRNMQMPMNAKYAFHARDTVYGLNDAMVQERGQERWRMNHIRCVRDRLWRMRIE